MHKRAVRILMIVGVVVLGWGMSVDVVNNMTRLAIVFGFASILLFLAVWSELTRRVLTACALLVALFALVPVRDDSDALRREFVRALPKYVDVPYVWGGERANGIDCSGLLRRSWRDALLSRALTNPGLVRFAVRDFFVDATADDLRLGHDTVAVGKWPRLRDVPLDQRVPGDLIATADGTHILAFLEDGRVIEADPHQHRVIIFDDTSTIMWLDQPVEVVRWKMLQ